MLSMFSLISCRITVKHIFSNIFMKLIFNKSMNFDPNTLPLSSTCVHAAVIKPMLMAELPGTLHIIVIRNELERVYF